MTEQQQVSQYEAAAGSGEPADLWRNEVQDRLAHYKRRRGRRIEGAYTMRFPFPVEETAEPASAELPAVAVTDIGLAEVEQPAAVETSSVELIEADAPQPVVESAATVAQEASPVDLVLEAPPVPEEESATFVDTVPRPRAKRKVIAFPKHLSVAPEQMYRLADPVAAEAPRILDVPEELEAIQATPFLDGLGLDPITPTSAASPSHDHVELPCQPARISQRMAAAAVDMGVVLAGVAIGAAVAFRVLEYPQLSKPLWLGLLAATAVLWSAYQYLFLVYAGRTLGMLATRLRLRTFKGAAPAMKHRRLRVLAFYFSAVSLGMGLMCALADVDGFCWHDRLSRTFLTHQE
jgi:hypothetical protein